MQYVRTLLLLLYFVVAYDEVYETCDKIYMTQFRLCLCDHNLRHTLD